MSQLSQPLSVLGLTAYPPSAPSARVRLAQFAPFLAKHDIDLQYQPTLTDAEYSVLASQASPFSKIRVLGRSIDRAARGAPAHDLLLVHRLRLLAPAPGIDPPRRLDAYDLDDALFLGSTAAENRRFGWAKQEPRRALACLRRTRLAIVGNSYLADHARRYARRVEIVPSCVDPAKQPLHEHRPTEIVTVGWIGSRTTAEYLKPLLPVFERVNAQGMRARLVVVGGDIGMRADWLEHRPWSLDGQADDLATFDVGLMPLPDTEWARGKCGYKVLQYFAAGVPAIVSPVGVARDLVGRERGLMATTPGEWQRALIELLDDVAVRRQRGIAARAFVEQKFSYQHWAPELAKLLRSLAE